MTGETVTAGDLEGYDVLVFKLHGLPGQPYWYGDDWQTALTAETVRAANLDGAMVFAANCHAITPRGKAGEMVQALLDAGARAVVAGAGQNLASNWRMVGADLLGRWWVAAPGSEIIIPAAANNGVGIYTEDVAGAATPDVEAVVYWEE